MPNDLPPVEGEPSSAPRGSLVLRPIVVESRATLLIGLVMLVIGVTVGFLVRPLVPLPGASLGVAASPMASVPSSSVQGPAGVLPTAANLDSPSATREAATQAASIM
ncbi:MAG: hypothetical protein ABI847_19220, partial [Anaerolineales bacterium]